MSDTGHGVRPMTLREIADDEARTAAPEPSQRWVTNGIVAHDIRHAKCHWCERPWSEHSIDGSTARCPPHFETERYKNTGLRLELTEIINNAFKRASSAQQCALPDPSPFIEAIIGVVGRYAATEPPHGATWCGTCRQWFPADTAHSWGITSSHTSHD